MKQGQCIRMEEVGGPEVLRLAPLELPEPGPGEVRVAVQAVGLNFIDTYHRTGLYPVPLPFVPGVEAAGVVDAVGRGVETVAVGDRVGCLSGGGAYATHLNISADRLIPLPDDLDFDAAAAILLKGLTAWMLLFEVRRAAPGETALIWAPVGGVGSMLVPWARSLGMNVVAVTSSEDKADVARELGANHVVFRTGDVAAEVRELTNGQGVDVAYDSVGQSSQMASLKSLRPRGWYVSYGNASGPAEPVAPGQLGQFGSLVMTRPSLFHFTPHGKDLMRGSAALFGALAAGTLKPRVWGRRPLAEAADAQAELASGQTKGAIILKP